ncbi:hypothetical protein B484DRAFT_461543, partial [Ochromonadaceae sp. CCMP2298]
MSSPGSCRYNRFADRVKLVGSLVPISLNTPLRALPQRARPSHGRLRLAVSDSDSNSSSDDEGFEVVSEGDEGVPTRPVVDGAWAFNPQEVAKMKGFLANSVTAGTTIAYRPGIRLWQEHVRTLADRGCFPGEFLERVARGRDKALHVLLFCVHLYEDKGLRGEQISGALTHLRHHIDVNLEQTEFLSEGLVRKARKACGCSTEEIKALLTAKLASSKHPMVLEMVDWLRKNLWDGRGWDTIDHLDKKVVYLSICLGMDAGPRVSNLTWPDKKTAEDHCVRAKDVTANIMLSPTSSFSKIMGGPRLHKHLLAYDRRVHPGVQHKFPTSFPHITGLELVFLTSKTSRATRLTLPKPIALQRRSERESRLVDNLLLWFLHASKLQEEDPLFRRYHPSISTSLLPRRKPIAAAIKASAAALGFDQSRFSTKSMRSGFATTATANGMSAVERNYRGGWTEGSL